MSGRFYDFNQRVHLRRDPSQFGLIGCGGYGDVYDARTGIQLVFWEHKGADIVTPELAEDLMSVEELRERRVLFLSVMRRPEMFLLRLALRCLKYDGGIDWRDAEYIEVSSGHLSGHWGVAVNQYYVYVSLGERSMESLTWEDLGVVDCHWDDVPCSCYMCEKHMAEEKRIA
jgi:hypothetical protein